jgi:hypothetical protein
MVMKKIAYGLGLAIALVSCLDVEDRPVLSMLTEANSLTLTTADTLVITRAVTNSGRNDVWLNAAADAYEMTASGGTRVCDASAMLALTAPENVRIPAGQGIVDQRKFALSELPNCVPGNYFLVFVAHFRESEDAPDTFTLRTSSTTFQLTAPPSP